MMFKIWWMRFEEYKLQHRENYKMSELYNAYSDELLILESVLHELDKFLYKGVSKMTFKLSKNKKTVTITNTKSEATSPNKKKKTKSFAEKYGEEVDKIIEVQMNLFNRIISKPEIPLFRLYEVGNPDCIKKLIMRTAILNEEDFHKFAETVRSS